MATPSYREQQKAARAAASAQRKAEEEARKRQIELIFATKRLARQLVIDGIRARGDKVTDYLRKEIARMAEALISPALIEQARWRLEQNLEHLRNSRRPTNQGLPVNETHAQIEAPR